MPHHPAPTRPAGRINLYGDYGVGIGGAIFDVATSALIAATIANLTLSQGPGTASHLLTAGRVGAIVVGLIIGWSLARIGSPRTAALIPTILIAPAGASSWLLDDNQPLLAPMLLVVLAICGSQGAYLAHSTLHTSKLALRRVAGWGRVAGVLGASLGAALPISLLWLVTPLLIAVAALGWGRVRHHAATLPASTSDPAPGTASGPALDTTSTQAPTDELTATSTRPPWSRQGAWTLLVLGGTPVLWLTVVIVTSLLGKWAIPIASASFALGSVCSYWFAARFAQLRRPGPLMAITWASTVPLLALPQLPATAAAAVLAMSMFGYGVCCSALSTGAMLDALSYGTGAATTVATLRNAGGAVAAGAGGAVFAGAGMGGLLTITAVFVALAWAASDRYLPGFEHNVSS